MTYFSHNKFIRIKPSQASDPTEHSNFTVLGRPAGSYVHATQGDGEEQCLNAEDNALIARYETGLSDSQPQVLLEYVAWGCLTQSVICLVQFQTSVTLVIFSLSNGLDSVGTSAHAGRTSPESSVSTFNRETYLIPAPQLCFPANNGESVYDDFINACKKRSKTDKFWICRLPIIQFLDTLLIFL